MLNKRSTREEKVNESQKLYTEGLKGLAKSNIKQ